MTEREPAAAGQVLAVGELLWDLLPSGPRLGGAMANLALGCARLGRAARLITCVGDDERGSEALLALQAVRLTGSLGAPSGSFDTSLIQIKPGVPTGVVDVAMGPDGRPGYNIAKPAAWDDIELTAAALAAAAGAAAICFGTLAQRAEPSRATLRRLVLATPEGCLRVLDTNIRPPYVSDEVVRWSLGHATVAKISEEELDTVSRAGGGQGVAIPATGDSAFAAIERCGRAVLAAYPNLHLLAITMGPDGSLLLTPEKTHYHPGFPAAVADTVGAGDAFTAGLVHAWLGGAPLAAVNEVGNLCGSFVASRQGATPVFPSDLLHRIAGILGFSG